MDNNLLIELEKRKDARRAEVTLFAILWTPLKSLVDVAANADAEGGVQDRLACRHVVCTLCPPRGSPVPVCRGSSWYR